MAVSTTALLRVLSSTGRRTALWVVTLLLGLGAMITTVLPAEAATKPPSGLSVTVTGSSTLDVSWKAVKGAARYRVAFDTSSAMKKPQYAKPTATSVQLAGLEAGQRYYVKVKALRSSGSSLTTYSSKVSVVTGKAATTGGTVSASAELRLGTFNIKCFNCMGDHPNERSWWDRRADVVSDIESQHVDVLGVQEASQAWLPEYAGGKGQDLSQFEDLRNRLGGSWKLTNANRNNCVKAKTPTSCVYKDQGASKGTKVLYDSSRVTMLDQGSKLLPSPEDDRFMAWAIFQQLSTGKKFFFATTHLEPAKNFDLHVQEATTVADEVAKRNPDHLPTFITGDMNSYKNTLNNEGEKDNPVWDVFVDQYGYVEPLGNASNTTTDTVGATVEHRINTPLSSFNDFVPNPTNSYFGRRPNGTYLDYIFTSKKVRVLEWENVAHLDANHVYVGKQASDHNMQRATVLLP